MPIGDINKTIHLNSINIEYYKGYTGLYLRITPSRPIIDFIPNNDELSNIQYQKAKEIDCVALEIVSTQKAETNIITPVSGLIAVVVPTFRDEKYIELTLESIINQDYENYEILIVNDGSDDKTVDIVHGFMEKFTNTVAIKCVQIPHMGHAGISRNIALYNLLHENTEYIAFMDGDDLYADEIALKVLVNTIKLDSRAIAVYGDYDMISDDGMVIAKPRCLKRKNCGSWEWKKHCKLTWNNLVTFNLDPYHLQCLMLRTGTPYLPYNPRGEDAEFYCRLYNMSAEQFDGQLDGIRQVPHVIAHYRKRLGSITNSKQYYNVENDTRKSHISKNKNPSKDTISDSNEVPPFYKLAGVPDEYITAKNISHWATKRWLRLTYRALFRGDLKTAHGKFKCLLKDKRIRKRDLMWLPFKQLFTDSGVTDLGMVLLRRIWKKKLV